MSVLTVSILTAIALLVTALVAVVSLLASLMDNDWRYLLASLAAVCMMVILTAGLQ